MLKPLKSTLTAMMLSAVAVTPVATISFMASAEMAIAKGKKDKAERGNRGGKGGKPAWAGKGGGKGKAAKTGGQGKAKKFAAATTTSDCPPEDDTCVPDLRQLHPSELGNMNGALNASENAILAHIRNGNMSNGPVGHMAALAVAGYDRDAALELAASPLAQDYAALDAAAVAASEGLTDGEGNPIVFENYEDYLAYAAENGPLDSMTAAESSFGANSLDAAAQSVVDAEGNQLYDDYEQYKQAVVDGTQEPDVNVLAAESVADLGYDATTAENLDKTVEDAEASYADAMAAMQKYWNKGDSSSDDADDLAAMLEARLDSYQNVNATIEEQRAAEEPALTEGEVVCEEGDVDCTPDETALLDQ